MTVKQLCEECNLDVVTLPCKEREVNGVYIGDLLSWVMGRAAPDNAWITIMSNINVIAVATLSDASAVIFAEGVKPEDDVISTAEKKGVNLLSSSLSAYELAVRLHSLGL